MYEQCNALHYQNSNVYLIFIFNMWKPLAQGDALPRKYRVTFLLFPVHVITIQHAAFHWLPSAFFILIKCYRTYKTIIISNEIFICHLRKKYYNQTDFVL